MCTDRGDSEQPVEDRLEVSLLFDVDRRRAALVELPPELAEKREPVERGVEIETLVMKSANIAKANRRWCDFIFCKIFAFPYS